MLPEFLTYLEAERRYSPLTIRNYRRDIERFLAWLEENGLTADPTALTEVPDPCEGRFDTLAAAIAHIDHILRFPDLLLII